MIDPREEVFEPEQFDIHVFLDQYDLSAFTPSQILMLGRCTKTEYCDVYIERFMGKPDEVLIPLIDEIKRSMVVDHSVIRTPFEKECYDCVVDYEWARVSAENRNFRATYTRKSARLLGWKGAIERIVAKDTSEDSDGFKALKDTNQLEFSYEAFVLKCDNVFSDKAVSNAIRRLRLAGFMT